MATNSRITLVFSDTRLYMCLGFGFGFGFGIGIGCLRGEHKVGRF